ncbi:thioredoxin [candidate division WOR-3 bacterium]|uniref:Thioredoxin n=1 Tax=candidate division WOR-3 bacterium TaxID=2052148 RepID=A0A660SF63_UNCW3|nr:MAG: thioredoxin [candidate division WOR-3 bacterium]
MEVIELNDTNFPLEVLKSDIPVLVDFWAIWCMPCLTLAPVLEEIAKEMDGKIKVGRVNVDTEIKTATEYGIKSIPTLILFKGGEEVDRMVGALPKAEIIKRIEAKL